MDVNRVRQLQLVRGCARPRATICARRHAEAGHRRRRGPAMPAAALLPHLDAAGVHHLQRVPAGRVQQPAAERPHAVRVRRAASWSISVVVVADEDEEALVDDRRVVELFVRVPGTERRNGGVEHGGVAEAGVQVAGGERGRRAAERAGPQQVGAAGTACCRGGLRGGACGRRSPSARRCGRACPRRRASPRGRSGRTCASGEQRGRPAARRPSRRRATGRGLRRERRSRGRRRCRRLTW